MDQQQENKISIKGWEAVVVMLSIVTIIGVSLVSFNAEPHIPIFLVLLLLIGYGKLKKQEWSTIEAGIVKGVKSGIIPIIIFLLIGILIAVWMKSGTIPTLIVYGSQIISLEYFLVSVFIFTAIVGISIGSAFTTASTIGIAFMAIGAALDYNLAMVAGAIISGAFFGDKMSPLSDTTNLASSVCKIDLFEHIRHMLWTTIPAFAISAILFFIIGSGTGEANTQNVQAWVTALTESSFVHPIALAPMVVILFLAVRKTSAIPTMIIGILTGIAVYIVMQPGQFNIAEWMTLMQHGSDVATGNAQVDRILGRGGIQSKMWAVSLLLLALSMGGVLSELKIIDKLMSAIRAIVETRGKVVLSTVLSAIGINVSIGEQYMSLVITGEAYEKRYREMGLRGKHLSKALESGGTVINPLIPYGISGVFMASVLEVPVLAYLPFAFFCLLCPIITIIYGFTGISMKKDDSSPIPLQTATQNQSAS